MKKDKLTGQTPEPYVVWLWFSALCGSHKKRGEKEQNFRKRGRTEYNDFQYFKQQDKKYYEPENERQGAEETELLSGGGAEDVF